MKNSSRRTSPIISVIFSFYNEQNVLPELLCRLRETFSQLIRAEKIHSYELIFVNDNSTDNSESYLRQEISTGDIILINMSRNFGVSECVLAGMAHAKGDAVIYMDADLQDPPELIPTLIETWQNDCEVEVVYTTRLRRKGEHWLKLFVTRLGYRFINYISDIELHIDSGDFKLLSKRVVQYLLQMKEDRPYLRGLVSWVGFKQIPVFYERLERFDGRKNSKMSIFSKKVLYYWSDRALIAFSDAPLKFILFSGLMLSSISFLSLSFVLIQKSLGLAIPGWTAIMSAIIFLAGIQMTMLGFIGLYVGIIFRESKRRPQYIIKDVIRG